MASMIALGLFCGGLMLRAITASTSPHTNFTFHTYIAPLITWRPVHEHAPRRVDADLLVQLELGERQLHGLAHLLLLDVHAT